ncbi:MAG TPA: hypothetical protein VFG34_01185 [Sphingopyxis sp.]|nr:hypothetical protein [Sphingopyxis sp.]
MDYLIIKSGVVTNIVVADADFAAQQGWHPAPDGVGIGWIQERTGSFSPPPEAPPPPLSEIRASMRRLSRMEFKLMLRGLGHTEEQVTEAFAAIADPELRYLVDLAWREASYFRRSDALIDPAAAALGMEPEDTDAAWLAFAARLPPSED